MAVDVSYMPGVLLDPVEVPFHNKKDDTLVSGAGL